MEQSIFRAQGARYHASELARGPWDAGAQHAGALAALIATAFERHERSAEVQIARLGYELLRPIPFAPLELTITTTRPGLRVQELAAEVHAEQDGERRLICRASALRATRVPGDLPPLPDGAIAREQLPGLDATEPLSFTLNEDDDVSFATTMEMRAIGDPRLPGRGRVWMRLRCPLLDGEQPTPLARLAAVADFGNGIGASLPFTDFIFINADLNIHLQRLPRGEWMGMDARTLLHPGGTALAESVLFDLDGPVGRSFQTLVVAPR